jgi:hypothetical protein
VRRKPNWTARENQDTLHTHTLWFSHEKHTEYEIFLISSLSSSLTTRIVSHNDKIKAFSDLKILAIISSLITAATVIFGNWIYMAYRAAAGPRAFFMKENPAIHSVFFEFKEFVGLFPVPLAVATTYVIWRYGDQLIDNKGLRTWVGIAFAVAWAGLIIAYLLGAGITKLRSV